MRRRQVWRRFSFYTRQTRRDRGEGFLLSAMLGIGLALLFIWSINKQVMPIFTSMAETKVKNSVTRKLEQTISDYILGQNITYQDIITLEKDENGAIIALISNMSRLTTMRNGILIEISDALDAMDVKEFSVPVGSLTGISFLSGRGFGLPVQVISVGTAQAEFHHSFTAAGINQTYHQIMLDVTVTVNILLPGKTVSTDVMTQVCAAETIIVGGVPETYLQLEQP